MGLGIDGLRPIGTKKDLEDFLGRVADPCLGDALGTYARALMSNHRKDSREPDF